MKNKDLIRHLSELDPDKEIMILDSFNGGGTPRTINIGPSERKITKEDADESFDCERLMGIDVIVIGYGSY